jgi:hypothetical protein
MTMKLNLLALAALATIAGAAQAAPLTTTQAIAATNQLYISGSSALQKLVEGQIKQNCSGDTLSIWRSASGTTWAGSTTADTTAGASHNIYSCTLNATNDFGLTGDITVVKREAGGSGQGVFPIGGAATGGIAQLMMDIASPGCTAAGGLTAICAGGAGSEKSVQADMGISDAEPAVFNATFNKASAFAALSVSDTSFDAAPTPIGLNVVGLVVNQQLYNDLQADQVAQGLIPAGGVPSVPSTAFASILTSTYNSGLAWTPFFSAGSAAALKNTHINVAFRAAGSGTRASAGLFFNNYPSGQVPKNFANGVTTNTFNALADNGRSVFNASSSGNVIGAVNACGNDRYCVGILGLEQNLSAAPNTKFVNIDGASPTNARLGQYNFAYEATYQVNKTGLNGSSGKTFANAFGAALALPVNIYAANNVPTVSAFQGFLALPGKCTGSFATWTSTPVTPTTPEGLVCSRVTRGGNSNNTLTVLK